MPTERLHLTDSLLLRFEAKVLDHSQWNGAPSLVLDRTAFYAEGGGQLGDRGVLNWSGGTLPITDVQIDDAGVVHHLLLEPAPEAITGMAVSGAIDEERRRDFMSQHTGQHMLSRALLDVAKAETISSRLGSETSTIDLSLPSIDDSLLQQAEDLVNRAVIEDRPVAVLFPTADALAKLPLRRPPKVTTDIRILHIEGFDYSPCGGTHCARTGQVGPVRITKTERYKGMTRVTFLAGARTLRDYQEKDAALRELGKALKCGPLDVMGAITRLRNELKTAQQELGITRTEWMKLVAERLLAEHPKHESGNTPIVAIRESADLDSLRSLAAALCKRGDVVAFATAKDVAAGDWMVVVERGAQASFDCGAWLKAAAQKNGGRGGGKKEHAEGRLGISFQWSDLDIG